MVSFASWSVKPEMVIEFPSTDVFPEIFFDILVTKIKSDQFLVVNSQIFGVALEKPFDINVRRKIFRVALFDHCQIFDRNLCFPRNLMKSHSSVAPYLFKLFAESIGIYFFLGETP